MPPIEIVMPRMGLTMEEGAVVAWLKAENEPVVAGEPLLEIETDKSTVEIEAPAAGVLSRILVQPGRTVPIGAVIAYLTPAAELAGGQAPDSPPEPKPTEIAAVSKSSVAAVPSANLVGNPKEVPGKIKASPAARHLARNLDLDLAQVAGTGPGGRVVARNVEELAAAAAAVRTGGPPITPVAQKVARELAIDLSSVQGSGPGGQITRRDVERAALPLPLPVAVDEPLAAQASPKPTKAETTIPRFASPSDITGGQAFTSGEEPEPELLPLTRAHKLMAERMSSSFRSAPHFYLHVEVDARRLEELRASLLDRVEARYGVRLTYTDFLVKYCALALLRHPRLLQQWSEAGLLQTRAVDIGVAMDTPAGLVVPVIRSAAALGLAEIARRRIELAGRAQAGKLQPRDLELGAFTITNLGMFGVDAFDAILNPPQAAILAVGRIREQALVVDGQVIAAPAFNLSLSVDHRVLDGAAAARFLGDLVELLETPQLAQV